MNLQVNGEPVKLSSGKTLASLLTQLDMTCVRVATVVNGQVVPSASHDTHLLSDGDEVELLTFAAGG